MPSAPLPENETERLAALRDLRILDSGFHPALEALVEAAALACGTPKASVNLVDENRVWFKARYGVGHISESSREHSFSAYTILSDEILEVPDALEDQRFADNPHVLNEQDPIRFYAGAPLKLPDGSIAGTLCVAGPTPMRLDARQRRLLRKLADAVAHALDKWRSDRLLQETAKELRMSQEFLQRAGELAGVGGWSMDLTTLKLTWTEETCHIHGLPRGEAPDLQTTLNFYPERSRTALVASMVGMKPGEVRHWDQPFTRADGASRWLRAMCTRVSEPAKADRVVGACLDITEAHKLAQNLATQHELLRVTLRSIGDAVITADPQALVTFMNPVAERLTGWRTEEAIGRPLMEIFVIRDELTGETAENPVLACLQREETVLLNHRTLLISRQGEAFGIDDSAAPIRNEPGEIIGAVLIFRDVSQARRMSSEMSYRASHDALTGLLNRGEFERRLSALLEKAKADETEGAILFIDLDKFKLVNDTCGHPAGDELLVQISKLLGSQMRANDSLARLGGDEFGVLLDQCPLPQAYQLAQRICDRMEAYRFAHEGQRFRVGTSIGLAPVNSRWKDASEVLQAVDGCCYAAKAGGRNRVHLWSDSDHGLNARHGEVRWAARLEQALDDDRFVLFAQRIHSFDNKCQGLHAEVLLRMVDTDGSLLAPGAFLPAAERFHIAPRIDRWVLNKALAWMRRLPDVEAVEMLAINISGQSVGDAAFQAWTLAELGKAGPAIAGRICLEITETAAVTNLVDASAFIERLKVIGVRVALDDFGAGASSFNYLKSMGVDFLKIDGQFVRDILTNQLDEAAVRCFVQIAAVLGLRTIGEYTENAEVLEGLRAIGVDYAQGFHVHKPGPLEQLLAPAALVSEAA